MPDPVVTPTPTPPDPTVLNTPVSPVKADGTFIENWRETLPEELRSEKCLDTVTDFPNAIKQLVSHKKMIGANRVVVPTDKSTAEEREAFYGAIGRPKTAADYKVEVPEDLKELYPAERLKAFFEMAHAEGFTQKQAEAMLKHDMGTTLKLLEDQEKAEQTETAEAKRKTEEVLDKEFGAAKAERIHVANRLVSEIFGNDKDGELAFLEKFGNDVDFIRFASKAGAKLIEHKALVAEYQGKNTPAEAQVKIRQLQNTPGYLSYDGSFSRQDGTRGQLSAEERNAITEQIREQYKLAYPEKSGR